MQAGRALPQTRWTHPRRKPAYRRDLARVSEAALRGLPAGPSGARTARKKLWLPALLACDAAAVANQPRVRRPATAVAIRARMRRRRSSRHRPFKLRSRREGRPCASGLACVAGRAHGVAILLQRYRAQFVLATQRRVRRTAAHGGARYLWITASRI